MKDITNDDLTLLYYGEPEDPGLAARVAASTELSARFEALCAELKLADAFVPPERGEDYGAQVWEKIAPKLQTNNANASQHKNTWFSALTQPRLSLAGVFSLAIVAVLAFLLGRNGGPGDELLPPESLPPDSAALLAGIDPTRLLSQKVAGHLDHLNLVFTQFANMPEADSSAADLATDMLVANRLYRRAAAAQGNRKLASFLADLEPLLIELAHDAHSNSPTTHERMQQEINDGLLFRVRVFNQQLNANKQTI